MTMSLHSLPARRPEAAVDLDRLALRAHLLACSPEIWRPLVRPETDGRWYVLLLADKEIEAWLMGWPAWERIELHDHGGSSGAICVVDGCLLETWVDGRRLRRRRLRPGQTVAFGAEHIHDVVGTERGQSLSVHVYSPRLRQLNFYEAYWGGRLEWRRTDPTGGPELSQTGA